MNLAAVAPNYRDAGIGIFVVASSFVVPAHRTASGRRWGYRRGRAACRCPGKTSSGAWLSTSPAVGAMICPCRAQWSLAGPCAARRGVTMTALYFLAILPAVERCLLCERLEQRGLHDPVQAAQAEDIRRYRRHMRQAAAFSSHRDVEVVVDVAHSNAKRWRTHGTCTPPRYEGCAFAEAGPQPGQSQALLVRFRTCIDTHTDQVIISGSLLLAHRQQPLPDPHLGHPQISMELSLGRRGEQTGRQ